MSHPALRGALLVLCAALAVALFFETCEKRTETRYTGLQGEARSNRYLAAQRLLEAMGREVRALDGVEQLDELPPGDATLIAPVNRNEVFGAERSLDLVRWVRGGGHLVIVTWSLWEEEDRSPDFILDPLGIRQYMHESPDEESGESTAEPDEPVSYWEDEVATVEVAGRAEPLAVQFDPYFYFEGPDTLDARWAFGDANGVHLLTVRLGEGWITALTDDFFLANPSDFAPDIGEHDHAELVVRLAGLGGRQGPVWILWSSRHAGAMTLLWRYGWMVLLAAAALAIVWVWHSSHRFGPQRPDDPVERRRLMEHIEAAGRFQLVHHADEALVGSVRDAIQLRLRERHPRWLRLDPRELNQRLAELTGIPADRVARALAFSGERDRERLTRRISVLEIIRKAL